MLYITSLLLLGFFNAALHFRQNTRKQREPEEQCVAVRLEDSEIALAKLQREYFLPYSLIMAADWLQGPHIYSLYKHEKGLNERTITGLFMTGYFSAAVSSLVVGAFADQAGRKTACLACCVAYAASCILILSNNKLVLFIGRALGGLSTTIQFSAFETWLVSEHQNRGLSAHPSLNSFFTASVSISGILAIITGIIGEGLVVLTGTRIAPFLMAGLCFSGAFVMISRTWNENYGASLSERPRVAIMVRIQRLLLDKRVLAVGFVAAFFESSMNLFALYWSPVLILCQNLDKQSTSLPLGLIFSNLMCSMMIGSTCFSILKPTGLSNAARVMLGVLVLSTLAIFLTGTCVSEASTFGLFLLFEACVGAYFPAMSNLKSIIVEDRVRAEVYSLIRLPLNMFVVVTLGVLEKGDRHVQGIFGVMGIYLMLAAFITQQFVI